jgi:hypothetical protein
MDGSWGGDPPSHSRPVVGVLMVVDLRVVNNTTRTSSSDLHSSGDHMCGEIPCHSLPLAWVTHG